MLLALGNPTIDFFSLDVEMAEEKVLEIIPWDKVDIRVVLVEVSILVNIIKCYTVHK